MPSMTPNFARPRSTGHCPERNRRRCDESTRTRATHGKS
jgi:hypothetical protein